MGSLCWGRFWSILLYICIQEAGGTQVIFTHETKRKRNGNETEESIGLCGNVTKAQDDVKRRPKLSQIVIKSDNSNRKSKSSSIQSDVQKATKRRKVKGQHKAKVIPKVGEAGETKLTMFAFAYSEPPQVGSSRVSRVFFSAFAAAIVAGCSV